MIAAFLISSIVGIADANFASRCYVLGRARIDPIVNFGATSAHEHTFVGSDAVSAWTRTGRELSRNATCTSCGIGDTSSYWFPSLFWNGEYAEVADASVYWSNSVPGTNDFRDIVLFPPGLRMIEGSPSSTATESAAPHYDWRCFGDLTMGYRSFPPSTCPDNKMRLSLRFPSCWNMQHRHLPSGAHMAHTTPNGECPPGFARTWSLRLEVDFRLDPSWVWGAGRVPNFVIGASRSPYSVHADFFNGMPVATQRLMMDECGRLGGDHCNIRPERLGCNGKYLNAGLPIPAWSRHTKAP